MNLFDKILFICVDFPSNFLRDLTIPSCELRSWNRTFFTIFPVTSVFFILLITNNIMLITLNVFVSIGVAVFLILICVILNQITYRNRLPSQIIVIY